MAKKNTYIARKTESSEPICHLETLLALLPPVWQRVPEHELLFATISWVKLWTTVDPGTGRQAADGLALDTGAHVTGASRPSNRGISIADDPFSPTANTLHA